MQTINAYTNYCTQEQTNRAIKLGCPCESPEDYSPIKLPTTQQMIGWLREKGFLISVYGLNPSFVGSDVSYHGELEKYDLPTVVKRVSIGDPNNTELDAIDAALCYLEYLDAPAQQG